MERLQHVIILHFAILLMYIWSSASQHYIVCPEVCHCDVKSLSVDCSGRDLRNVPVTSSVNIRSLNLSNNRIEQISPSDFLKFTEIESIDLSNNLISQISTRAFSENVNLQFVNLADNFLTLIPLFHGKKSEVNGSEIIQLKKLIVAGNRLSNLEFRVFQRMSMLDTLDLSRNNLSDSLSFLLPEVPNVRHLKISENRLSDLGNKWISEQYPLEVLDVSRNFIHDNITLLEAVPNLISLNLTGNMISNLESFQNFELLKLTTLFLSENPLENLRDGIFVGCPELQTLELTRMRNLVDVDSEAFRGLHKLRYLKLNENSLLAELDSDVFTGLSKLESLDLRSNSLQVLRLDAFVLEKSNLEIIELGGNAWSCDCHIVYLNEALQALRQNNVSFMDADVLCSSPSDLKDHSILDLKPELLSCPTADSFNTTDIRNTRLRVSFSGVVDCPEFLRNASSPLARFSWLTNHKKTFHLGDYYMDELELQEDIFSNDSASRTRVLRNGSLFIADVKRNDAGHFVCTITDFHGNRSAVVVVMLDYDAMSMIAEFSVLVGFLSAFGFFLIAVVLGAIRYFTHVCSKEERVKRKSIREVLGVLRSSSHMDRLTAYKTAKLDRFSSFRSATMDQLVAFKTAKIDKLRTYKQATVLSIQQYLDRMRDHYSDRTTRIKRNCAARSERLRRNYAAQRGRMKDNRSAQMKKIRDNYIARRTKLRLYSSEQMVYLHEQYKVQQQHVMKLLELLDIGNCVNVIRDDCERTESIIFDDSMDDLGEYNIGGARGAEGSHDDDLSPDAVFDDEDDDDNCFDEDDLGDAELEKQIVEDAQMTMEDVLGEILANVESIRNKGHGPSLGVGEGDAGATAGASLEDPNIVSLKISMRDLHSIPTPNTPLVEPRGNSGKESRKKKKVPTATLR